MSVQEKLRQLFLLDSQLRGMRSRLDSAGLVLGAVVPDKDVRNTDTTGAYVYKQSPEQFNDEKKPNPIHRGQSIDIWLAAQRPQRNVDSTATGGAAQSPGAAY